MEETREVRARVVNQEKGLYRLRFDEKECLGEVSGRFRYEAASAADYPAVGDYVIASISGDESRGIINMLFPRKSCFMRKAAGKDKREQVVAANIDTVFLCMSLNRDFNIRRLERYLATAWDSGAVPVVLLTKKDLCEDPDFYISQVEKTAAGVEILAVSSADASYQAVVDYLKPDRTYAFMGSSGVGKSTLINRLMGKDALKTDGLRNDDKGHHTTTHRELIELACGAFVIDTPGMRELGMWDHEEGIDTVFAEIEALSCQCRFSDCSHEGEPGCAVMRAISEGSLSEERYQSYLKLKRENSFTVNQTDYLKAKNEKFKQIAKNNKKSKR